MKKLLVYLLILHPIFLVACEKSAFPEEDEKKESEQTVSISDLDIYLLIGQSNMAGRAEIQGSDKDTLVNVFLYTGIQNEEWEKAANPLNKYSSIRKDLSMQKLGPGYAFSKKMTKLYPDKQIGLVVNAQGGTSIDLWKPGSTFFREAVSRTNEALKYGSLKGIVWHQGESDASKYAQYMPKLLELIRGVRQEFNILDLPFVVGQLSEDKSSRKNFNQMIITLPDYIDNVGVIKSDSTLTIDSTHFDSESQHLMGIRYAIEMQKLLDRK